jgi:hypothetical protein
LKARVTPVPRSRPCLLPWRGAPPPLPLTHGDTRVNAAGAGASSAVVEAHLCGPASLTVTGTFGGTTVKAQGSPDGVNFADINGLTLSAAGVVSIDAVVAKFVKIVTVGGTGVSVNAWLSR